MPSPKKRQKTDIETETETKGTPTLLDPIKIIPPQVLAHEELFDGELPSQVIEMMEKTDEDLHHSLSQKTFLLESKDRLEEKARLQCWIAIAISHTSLSLENLLDLAVKLSLSLGTIFKAMVIWNHVPLLVTFIEKMKSLGKLALLFTEAQDALYYAGLENNILLLRHLKENETDFLKTNNFAAASSILCGAAALGHLGLIQEFVLKSLAPAEMLQALTKEDFFPYQLAVQEGHLPIIKFFEGFVCEHFEKDALSLIKSMRIGAKYHCIRDAISSKHADLRLQQSSADPARIQSRHVDVRNHLCSTYYTEEEINQIIKDKQYALYQDAVKKKSLSGMLYLEEKIGPSFLEDMRCVDDFINVDHAIFCQDVDIDIVEHLFSSSPIFKYVEEQTLHTYDKYLNSFVAKKIEELRLQPSMCSPKPQTPPDAQFLFYLAHNLIRRGAAFTQDLAFLLTFPELQKIAHDGNNQLLELALLYGNINAKVQLLAIPTAQQLTSPRANTSSSSLSQSHRFTLIGAGAPSVQEAAFQASYSQPTDSGFDDEGDEGDPEDSDLELLDLAPHVR